MELINSEFYDGFGGLDDRLRDPAWRARFFNRWHGIHEPNAQQLAELERLRALLRAVIESLEPDGYTPSQRQLTKLNRVLRASGLQPTLTRERDGIRVQLESARSPWQRMLGEIVVSLGDALAADPRRLKVCANDGCRWVFVDESRNRSRRWCDPAACGNLSKVRAYRKRQRTTTTQ
jgi:predicted RNA-binding Zn ribbon-like protein